MRYDITRLDFRLLTQINWFPKKHDLEIELDDSIACRIAS